MTTELIAAALSDMDIHSIENYEQFDPVAFERNALNERRGLIPQIEPRYRYPYFAHIFNGGYSAGYYFYTWAEVLDKDAFEAFRESGDLFNRQIAHDFRYKLLARGGSEDGMALYRAFRGKDPPTNGRCWSTNIRAASIFCLEERRQETAGRHLQELRPQRRGAVGGRQGTLPPVYLRTFGPDASKFGQNSLAATNAFALNITDPKQVPSSRASSRRDGGRRQGPRRKGLDRDAAGTELCAVRHLLVEPCALKERFWRAYNSRALGGQYDNTEIVRKIANTRLKIANLLGYKCYADYVLERRMAENTPTVQAFLGELLAATKEHADADYRTVGDYAAAHGFEGELMPWDWGYYSQKYQERCRICAQRRAGETLLRARKRQEGRLPAGEQTLRAELHPQPGNRRLPSGCDGLRRDRRAGPLHGGALPRLLPACVEAFRCVDDRVPGCQESTARSRGRWCRW